MKEMIVALRVFVVLTILTGIVYPLAVTGLAQAVFPQQSNGSLIRQNGQVVGSSLIGRQYDDPDYFWGRPSATSPDPYNGASSSGSNLGPTNPTLMKAIQGRVDALMAADPGNDKPIPTDLATASGSGLDPHISVAAAEYQIPRIARLRGMKETDVRTLVSKNTQGPEFGVFGERVVNVQELNLDLDRAKAR